MLFTDVIRTKRDGGELSREQIRFFVDGLADESLPAEQVSSLAMAVFLNGMSFAEAATLTIGMSQSGTVLDWSDAGLDGPVVDKHSTGGVGDKVSFLLAPIAAACGCYVPMISGRGLGHTGGTTDKAEAIPGYNTAPDFETFKRVVKSVGCAVIGQTADLAPADHLPDLQDRRHEAHPHSLHQGKALLAGRGQEPDNVGDQEPVGGVGRVLADGAGRADRERQVVGVADLLAGAGAVAPVAGQVLQAAFGIEAGVAHLLADRLLQGRVAHGLAGLLDRVGEVAQTPVFGLAHRPGSLSHSRRDFLDQRISQF